MSQKRAYTSFGDRTIKAVYQYVYVDSKSVYDRPPYVVNFNISYENAEIEASLTQFSLVNLHLRPTQVLNESLELRNVVDKHRSLYNKNSFGMV